MNKQELDKLWNDPANYKLNCIYVCKEDPRVVVPKRKRWQGWTVNFAHMRAWGVLILLMAAGVVPIFFELLIWPKTTLGFIVACIFSAILVYATCLYYNAEADE